MPLIWGVISCFFLLRFMLCILSCCCCPVVQSCLTLSDPLDCSTPGLSLTISQRSPKFMSIELVMPSNHLILCRPLFLVPSIFLSIRVFSNESALCIRWPKDWSFSFSISPSALSFLYGPTLTSAHDYRKNHSFDYTDLCPQSDVSAFQ